jgi:hypothetical protein
MISVRKNTLLDKIQTALVLMCFTGISFCVHFLWDINIALAKNEEVNDRQNASIATLTILVSDRQRETEKNGHRLTYLEARLPDEIKIKNK